MTVNELPCKERLLELFNYDRGRGALVWRSHWNPGTATKIVGKDAGDTGDRYVRVGINRVWYGLHRIIYFLETGEQPECVDHIDGDTYNNHYGNLRASTTRDNASNRKRHRGGALVGAYFDVKSGSWYSGIYIKPNTISLGTFRSEENAHEAYMLALSGDVEGAKALNQSRRNSDLRGLSYNKQSKKWRAQIKLEGDYYILGYYETVEEARQVYDVVENSDNTIEIANQMVESRKVIPRGTTYCKRGHNWVAQYWSKERKKVHLGRYNTEAEAHEAYLKAVVNG